MVEDHLLQGLRERALDLLLGEAVDHAGLDVDQLAGVLPLHRGGQLEEGHEAAQAGLGVGGLGHRAEGLERG
ncbi:MAG: hypothetical protein ACK559_27695, partial [bacterium]